MITLSVLPALLFLALSFPSLRAAGIMEEVRAGSFAARQPSGPTLRVIDWNIERGRAFPQILAAMHAAHPDIAILQEVDLHTRRTGNRDIAASLARELKMNYVFAPEFEELSQRSGGGPALHGQAILTSLPIRGTRILRFSTQSGFWRPRTYLPHWPVLQRRLGGRMALVTELQFGKRLMVIYNVHLESRSFGRLQAIQLNEVLHDAARYSADTPILIAGDLNCVYNPRAIHEMLKQAGFQNSFGERHVRTHVIIGALDWICARGPLRFADPHVVRTPGSDHYPVSTQVSLLDDAAAKARGGARPLM